MTIGGKEYERLYVRIKGVRVAIITDEKCDIDTDLLSIEWIPKSDATKTE